MVFVVSLLKVVNFHSHVEDQGLFTRTCFFKTSLLIYLYFISFTGAQDRSAVFSSAKLNPEERMLLDLRAPLKNTRQ